MFDFPLIALAIWLTCCGGLGAGENEVANEEATTSTDQPITGAATDGAGSSIVSSSLNVDKWAIVVGISDYKHKNEQLRNLDYAHRDAEELYQLIQTASAGGFAEDHIVKLVDEEATTSNITRALRSFLKKPAPDDVVLIYFSCHGATDPDRSGLVYLVTHDTDPDDISGTALPMREIDLCLREYLLAKRVVIIADTCHSGAIGQAGRKSVLPISGSLNDYLKRVAESKEGTALLTSAEANEVSLEDERWGGGHGVFTHYLLEGMRGKADQDEVDGVVTVGELFEYVRENVKQATNNSQHPHIGSGWFDRRFPMAITGGITAREHFELGRRLLDQGRRLGERRYLASAAYHLSQAQNYFRDEDETREQACANRLSGLAQLALEDYDQAVRAFEEAARLDEDGLLVDIDYYLGIAQAKQGESDQAARRLEAFVELAPDHEYVPFARKMLNWLEMPARPMALLIGIADYRDDAMQDLRGPVNDVDLIRQVLIDHCGIHNADITTLTNADATYENILRALQRLEKATGPRNAVLILFSGSAVRGDSEDFLLCHDSSVNPSRNVIAATELHQALSNIQGQVVVAFDCGHNKRFVNLAKRARNYRVIFGASPGQMAFEFRSQSNIVHGAFTLTLAQTLRELPHEASLDSIVERVNQQLGTKRPQTACLIGDGNQRILPDGSLVYFDYSQRWTFPELTNRELLALYQRAHKRLSWPFPELHYSFGMALLQTGEYRAAARALETATSQRCRRPDLGFYRGVAQLHSEQYGKAIASLDHYATTNPQFRARIDDAIATINTIQQGRKHALLVGINEYIALDIPDLHGAVRDVRAVEKLLIDRFGFDKSHINVLTDRDASRKAIIEQLNKLVAVSRSEPALFYFSGIGSVDQQELPTVVSADGRTDDVFDISIPEIVELVGRAPTNLVTIMDAEWADTINPIGDRRFVAADERPQPRRRGIPRLTRIWLEQSYRDLSRELKVGRVSIYGPVAIAFQRYVGPRKGFVHVDDRKVDILLEVGTEHGASEGSEFYVFAKGTTEFSRSEIIAHLKLTKVSRSTSSATVLSSRPVIGPAIAISKEVFDAAAPTVENAFLTFTRGDLSLTLERSSAVAEDASRMTFAEWSRAASDNLGHELLIAGANPNELLFANVVAEQQIQQALKQVSDENLKDIKLGLQRLLEQRKDLRVKAHLDLGITHAALGDGDAAIAALEQALEYGSQQSDQSLAEVHYHLGRISYESHGDLNRAVSELRKAVKHLRGESDRIRARYYLGQAIRALVERDLLTDAERELQAYLDAGAPLGQHSEVQAFLNERSNARQAASNSEH